MRARYRPGAQNPRRRVRAMLTLWPDQSDGAEIPNDRLAALQERGDEPPTAYVPPIFSVDKFGLPAPGGEDRIGMEAVGKIPQRLTWRSNLADQLGDTGGLLGN